MKILQFISHTDLNNDMNSKFMTVLVDALSNLADVTLTTSVSQFKKMARTLQPDIIHVHGCWSLPAVRVERWAEKNRYPVVLSLHGQMLPWHYHHHYLLSKLPRYLLFEHKAIQEAEALHVHSEMELSTMEKIGANTRMGMVPNCIVTHSITPRQMALKMFALYLKVIDSNTFRLMTSQELEAESQLLSLGIAIQEKAPIKVEEYANLSRLSLDSWRKIFIHAKDEHVLTFIIRSAQALGVDIKSIVIENVDRFPQKLRKPEGHLPGDRLLSRTALVKSALDNVKIDEKPDVTELTICIMIHNLKHHINKGVVTRLHLADLFSKLRYTEYDEDKLQRMLHALKLEKFTARILTILGDSFRLEEGYMPIEPVDDKLTNKIRQQLIKANVQ